MSEALQATTQKMLRQYIEQIENLEEDKRNLVHDITNKYSEAEAQGFDKKIMKAVVRLRRKSASEREEEETILDVYMNALISAEE